MLSLGKEKGVREMSEWTEMEEENIDIDIEQKEFNLLVGFSGYSGNIYVSLTFEQIKKMAKEVEGLENE